MGDCVEKPVKVSVLVTFYNQKEYIQQNLESILQQKTTYTYEIICGDDGSSDGTFEELLKWKGKYPDIISVYQMPRDIQKKYEPIVRVSNNRVNLLKHARGEYVYFLDGDDFYIDNQKIQIQVDFLEHNKKAVACGHPVKMVWDNESDKDKVIGRIADKAVLINKYVYWSFIWLHADSFLYRNVFLKDKKRIEEIDKDFFDDNLITCYFLQYGDVLYCPRCMVAYRQFSSSSWNNRSELQKAFVNMKVYCASKKILQKAKLMCLFRCHEAWVAFYKNKNEAIEISMGMRDIIKEKFVERTVAYKNKNHVFKILYNVRYFFALHCSVLIKILNRTKILTYRNVSAYKE